ncbi:MAG: signal peptidase II [Solirubrobacteraceae bacterium]
MSPSRTTLAATAMAGAVVGVDQLTKATVRGELALGERRDLLAGIDLVNVRNSGIAFGLLADGGALLMVGTALALLALVVFFVTHSGRALVWIPTGLLLGGAIGNLIDRALEGSVTDFVKLPHFPAFNVADTAITFGVLALLYVLEGPPRRRAEAARDG